MGLMLGYRTPLWMRTINYCRVLSGIFTTVILGQHQQQTIHTIFKNYQNITFQSFNPRGGLEVRSWESRYLEIIKR